MSDSDGGAAQRNRSLAREAALKKIKDRKERDRIGGESEDEVPSTSDKRIELQRRRMQMRESGDSALSDSSTGNQGPRSPVRSSRKGLRTGSTLQSVDSLSELDNENGEFLSTKEIDQQDDEDEDEVELNDNYAEIFTVNQPLYIMPLNFMADITAKNESSVQPLLIVPAPHPEIDFRNGFNIFKTKLYQNPDELALLSGEAEVIPTNITKSSSELVSLLHNSGDAKTGKLVDGVSEEKTPVLSDLLMSGEYLNQPIANLVSSNIDLSRVTQRTLRDIQRNIADKNLKEKIHIATAEQKAVDGDENKISSISLLKQVSQIPVLNLINDPFYEYPTQPLLPTNNISFGGQLGNWNNTATDREKLGPLALSGANTIARKSAQSKSLLRINIHEMKLLSHNLMSDEELIYHSMKKAYVQYIAIFENKTIQYLSFRLLSIINELKRFIKENNDRGITAGTVDTLLLHYRDLMETLPALCELRTNVDTLAANLYNNWRNIQELRRQKGFVSTKASVTVRKLSDDDSHKFDDFANALRGAQSLVETVQLLLGNYSKILATSEPTAVPTTGSLQAKQHKATSTLADSTKVSQVVEQCVNELSRYKSLQPEFVLRLTDQYAISTDQTVDVAEGKRRKLLEELSFKVVLKVNDTVITNTVAKLEYPALCCEFNKKFDFRVFNQPHDVSVDVHTFYNSVLGFDDAVFVANVPIFLPGQRVVDSQSSSYSKSTEITLPTHAFAPTAAWYSFASSPDTASGSRWTMSSLRGSTASDPVAAKPTIGAILISCDYEIGVVTTKHISTYDGIKSDDIALIRQQIITKSPGPVTNDAYKERDFQQLLPSLNTVDVNDPSSDGLVKTILMGKSVSTEFDSYYLFGKHFAESFSEDNQNYENYLKFSPNLRLQLLKLRDAKPYLFTDPLPLSDSVIQRSELYKKILITEGVSMTNGVDLMSMSPRADDIETDINNRLKVKGFLDRVRNSLTALKKRNIRKSITTNNVIAEVQYFYPIVLDDIETIIPARKRDLKPVPKVRVPQAVQVSHCDVLVQVVGAKNIPLRQDDTVTESSRNRRSNRGSSRGGRASDSDGERNEPAISDDVLDANKMKEKKRARSIMEVRFQERVCDTVCIEGAAPLWKQSFSYPFRAPQDDYTPSNIVSVDENVTFTLFDEYREDDAKRGGYLEGEKTTRTERRYLGSFTIPFSTLYKESRIEGVFRLDTPIFNFGYVPNDIEKKRLNEDSIFESSGVDAPPASVSSYNNGFFSYYWDYFGLDTSMGSALSSAGIHFRRKKRLNLDENSFLINAETLREFDYFACGKSSTYINVMLTLDPMLTAPPPQHVEISTHSVYIHDRQYCSYARQFLSELKSYSIHTRNREYPLFAQSSNGLNVFIPRFLTPMKPPMGFETRRACLHLISAFPFILDALSFIGDMDLFCTAKEAWQMGAGDEEEHASMLFNFLLYLQLTGKDGTSRDFRNSRAQIRGKTISYGAYPSEEVIKEESLFVVICKAIPEGSSMYVLLRDHRVPESVNNTHYSPDKFLLINACNGHVYSAADQRMPISDVYCLVTSYNIWANIQDSGAPYDVEYDVLNPYHWRPFFGARMPPPLASLQTVQEEMTYEPTDPTYALDIEKSIRQSIKNAIRRWRSRRYKSATTFHPDASSIIHDILPMLEDYKLLGPRTQSSTMDALSVQTIQDTINEKLKNVLRTRTLTGCPVNVPYSDVDAVLSKVKSMCVHETNDNDAQFVMAVRVFPLVNNLVSVWIYIGTVIARET